MKSVGVILSAGVGKRFGTDLPKQYNLINGKKVIEYVVDALKRSDIDDILIACGDEFYCQKLHEEYQVETILGGAERNETIGNVLSCLNAKNCYNKVLFFDSSRPNLSPEYINECLKQLDEYDAVVTTQKITDSLGGEDGVLDRSKFYLIQTPECFKLEALKNFDRNSQKTAIVQQLSSDKKIFHNFGLKNNIKITYLQDIETGSALLKNKIGNIAVVLAGGLSQRFGSRVHKQYLKLNGKEVLFYAIERLRQCKNIQRVILIVEQEEYFSHYIENKYNVECVCGGETRNKSIKKALDYIKQKYLCNKILFHDATRPLVKTEFYEKCVDELENYDGVAAYQEITDAICNDSLIFFDRDDFNLIQTPEVFYFDKIYDVFNENSREKSIIGQLKSNNIHLVKSDKFGFKITYPSDLFLAEQLDKTTYFETSKFIKKDVGLSGKKVLVFGGSGGVGSAILEKLKRCENVSVKAPTSKEIDLKTITVEKIKDFCQNFEPDYVLNAAAVSFSDSDGIVEKFDDVFAVNVKSNLVIIDYLKSIQKPTKFVMMSSSSSTKGRKNITNYSASKAALNSVIESLAEELAEQNIFINAVIPEKINTPMLQKLHKTSIDQRELLETFDVVEVILYLLENDCYGQQLHFRNGL